MLLFGVAVVGIVAAVYLALSAAIVASAPPREAPAVLDPARLAAVFLAVGGVIALGSLFKVVQLSRGGAAVAELMGGRLVEAGAADPLERRLLNVVEEMAIASGLPVPPVYLLDTEPGINAFAAGREPGDAVLGFTRGALEKLSRAELQGVVGHEFSHVLNGDMRLNLRLIGVLHGILVLGLVGEFVFRVAARAPRRSRDSGANLHVAALVGGLVLMVLGSIGTFFGKLIQAAVSRQREYLADASAVQFTRDNEGIVGALAKIGGFPSGSRVRDAHAGEVSHMLFEEYTPRSFSRMLATHPPLADRIRRLSPGFAGELERFDEPSGEDLAALRAAVASELDAGSRSLAGEPAGSPATEPDQPSSVAAVSLAARALLDAIPGALRDGACDPYDARAVVCVLVLSPDAATRGTELARLEQGLAAPFFERVARFAGDASRVAPEARLPLIDLCLRALHALTPGQYAEFTHALDLAIALDHRVDLFEACLRRIVRHHLDPQLLEGARPRSYPRLTLGGVRGRAAVVLSALAGVGHDREDETSAAYRAGAELAGLEPRALDPERAARDFDAALEALARLRPADKRRFLEAAAAVVEHDRHVGVAEAELLRAIAETLGVAVPPALAVGAAPAA